MSSIHYRHSHPIGWDCEECKGYNDILTEHCNFCTLKRPEELEFEALLTRFRRSGLSIESEGMSQSMNEREQLFADYFSGAYNQCIEADESGNFSMPLESVIEKIQKLEEVAFHAKASIQGADKALKERKARLSKEERDKLLTTPDLQVSDSIAGVAKRKDRITKMDKLAGSLGKLNISSSKLMVALGITVNEDKKLVEFKPDLKPERKVPTEEEILKKLEEGDEKPKGILSFFKKKEEG